MIDIQANRKIPLSAGFAIIREEAKIPVEEFCTETLVKKFAKNYTDLLVTEPGKKAYSVYIDPNIFHKDLLDAKSLKHMRRNISEAFGKPVSMDQARDLRKAAEAILEHRTIAIVDDHLQGWKLPGRTDMVLAKGKLVSILNYVSGNRAFD